MVVAVLVVEERLPVRRRTVVPAGALEGEPTLAGRHVDGVDVLESSAVEVAEQLVLAAVQANREALLRRQAHRAHVLVAEPDELLRLDAILGQVAERAIARLLHFLLRLQPLVEPVPEHEVDLLVGIGVRAASGVAAGRALVSLARRIALGGVRGAVALARHVDAEGQRLQVVGPLRVAVRADRHALGEGLVGGGIEEVFCGAPAEKPVKPRTA